MATEILNKNFKLLKSLHPNAYEALKESKPTRDYAITLSQSGAATLSYVKPDKNKIYLLSKYDPLREARRLIDSLNVGDSINFIVLGMGLGYQIKELIKSIPPSSSIIILENDRKLARLAFETNDFSQILTYPGLTLAFPGNIKEIPSLLENERINFSLNGYQLIQQNSLSEVNPKECNEVLKGLKDYFQTNAIEIKTLSAKSKIFSNNIYKNYKNLISSPGINVLKDSFSSIPAIICSAGPSLDKNIQILKTKRDNFLLISVATALKPLLKNNISPDFVVAVDPEDITTQFFNFLSESTKTWLVYDPVVPAAIPELFSGKSLTYDSTINLAQWLQKHLGENGSLGSVFSVAHASYQFAKHVGCSPIILIGQDLSFTKKRLHSKHSYYYQCKEDSIGRLKTMEFLDKESFKDYSKNLIERKNIFNKSAETTVALDTYSNLFANIINDFSKTFNATEGGIGIKEASNVLLREAINKHCDINYSSEKSKILGSIPSRPFQDVEISNFAKKQLDVFKEISYQLDKLETKFLKTTVISDEIKGKFVQEMKFANSNLLKNNETALLLQSYDYSGFLSWNKKTNDIMKRRRSIGSRELLNEEFLRDQEFLGVLKRSVEFNINVFEDFSKIVIST